MGLVDTLGRIRIGQRSPPLADTGARFNKLLFLKDMDKKIESIDRLAHGKIYRGANNFPTIYFLGIKGNFDYSQFWAVASQVYDISFLLRKRLKEFEGNEVYNRLFGEFGNATILLKNMMVFRVDYLSAKVDQLEKSRGKYTREQLVVNLDKILSELNYFPSRDYKDISAKDLKVRLAYESVREKIALIRRNLNRR